MTENELRQYILDKYPKENTSVEWKSYRNLKNSVAGYAGDDIVSYLSAIANMNGGVLILGIEDITANILGIDNFHEYSIESLPPRVVGNCTNLSTEGLSVEPFITMILIRLYGFFIYLSTNLGNLFMHTKKLGNVLGIVLFK